MHHWIARRPVIHPSRGGQWPSPSVLLTTAFGPGAVCAPWAVSELVSGCFRVLVASPPCQHI